jgi:signal transduction histidine kinase
MSIGRLRRVLLAFFLALAIPTAFLVNHAYGQLKWEAFHQHRQLAEEVSMRIDQRLTRLLASEEARGFGEYQFLVVEGEGRANFLQRSPLSTFPVKSDIPGLIGWFQVDSNGAFSSPLLPAASNMPDSYELDDKRRKQRSTLEARIQSILSANRLVGGRQVRASAPLETEQRLQPAAQPSNAPLAERRDEVGAKSGGRDKDAAPLHEIMSSGAHKTTRLQRALKEDEAQRSASTQSAQAAFDELSKRSGITARRKQALPGTLGRMDDLKLTSPYAAREEKDLRATPIPQPKAKSAKKRTARKELAVADYVPEAKNEQSSVSADAIPRAAEGTRGGGSIAGIAGLAATTVPRILTFESELDPFEFSLLNSGHFVLYRKVWRDGQRYIQGALVKQAPFLSGLVATAFEGTTLSRMSNLVVAWQGNVFATFSGDTYRSSLHSADASGGALLYRTRLSAPFAEMELVFGVTALPVGPGAKIIAWSAGVLALVLVIGIWLMHRLGARQLALASQQHDFVAAVSHELRTPITSIRMYAEMLQQGWANEEKKHSYYEFIAQESERLSRLIDNVLQLARMSHNDSCVQLLDIDVAQLMDSIRSKITSQVQHAGFELHMDIAESAATARLHVDADAFTQCIINLVDNALKFSAAAEHKVVEVACRLDPEQHIIVTVRDHGPGVARDQMTKVFELFYRSENELTRETVGTGIGLALVHQLVRAMHGHINVANDDPGAVFTLRLPARRAGAKATTAR